MHPTEMVGVNRGGGRLASAEEWGLCTAQIHQFLHTLSHSHPSLIRTGLQIPGSRNAGFAQGRRRALHRYKRLIKERLGFQASFH